MSRPSQPIDLRLNGGAVDQVVPYTTSATRDLALGGAIDTSTGALTTTLAPRSVTTFVGHGVSSSPLNVRATDAVVWRGEAATTDVTVENLGTTPVTATVTVSTDAPITVAPASTDVALAPGATATVPVTITAHALTDRAAVALRVVAQTGGGPATAVTATSTVRGYTTFVELCPNTPEEQVFLHENSSFIAPWANPDCPASNPRFADGTAKATYRFDVPADTARGTLTIDIGNQFLVETSSDGVTWRTVLQEPTEVRDLSNKAVRAVPLSELEASAVVYVRIGDSFPGDGWGGYFTKLRVDVVRDAADPEIPELPVPALVVLAATCLGAVVVRRRRAA